MFIKSVPSVTAYFENIYVQAEILSKMEQWVEVNFKKHRISLLHVLNNHLKKKFTNNMWQKNEFTLENNLKNMDEVKYHFGKEKK